MYQSIESFGEKYKNGKCTSKLRKSQYVSVHYINKFKNCLKYYSIL